MVSESLVTVVEATIHQPPCHSALPPLTQEKTVNVKVNGFTGACESDVPSASEPFCFAEDHTVTSSGDRGSDAPSVSLPSCLDHSESGETVNVK